MKVLIASSEISPLVKTGGLADALGALALHLRRRGIDVSVTLPKYAEVQCDGESLGPISIPVGDKTVLGSIEKTTLPHSPIPVYLVVQDHYFHRDGIYYENGHDYSDNLERFTFFSRAVLQLVIQGHAIPQVIHCHDWQTALIPACLKTLYSKHPLLGSLKTLFTIHNFAYQGLFPAAQLPITGIGWEHFHMEELEFYNQINLMKGGLIFSDAITTVSPTYAEEIQTELHGCGLDGLLRKRNPHLYPIMNGVDYAIWSPDVDVHIPQNFNRDSVIEKKPISKKALRDHFGLSHDSPERPLFGVISRLADQKGLDLLVQILPRLVSEGAQLVLLGSGDPLLEERFTQCQKDFPKQCGVCIAYNEPIAHLIEAGADIFLMPSRFEPCGLNQMYSLRYGTIPIVHKTGGLADTITDVEADPGKGNGFVFLEPAAEAFLEACLRALKKYHDKPSWHALMKHAMSFNFSWDVSAAKYAALYESMLKSSDAHGHPDGSPTL